MMHTAKFAVCSEIRTKHSTQSEYHVEFLNVKQEVGGGRVDWMELAQDRDGWRALVGTVRNFHVP